MDRDALLQDSLDPEQRDRLRQLVRQLLDNDRRLARALYPLARKDSRIGFEATNHYFYVPQDLVEKLINCHDLSRDPLLTGEPPSR